MRRPPAVARVLERVTTTVREHHMFEPGDRVLLCVSGGPDSVCLLESLVRLRRLFRIRLEVFHFDHRLRDGSEADAAYVKRLAARHALPFHLRVAADAPAKGESIESWATGRRGQAMSEVRGESGARVVVEGHTLDDQAETVLLNLIIGSGLDGLAGIWPDGSHAQPLLDVPREDVEAFCRALGLRPRHDPTNEDRRFLRNRIRLDAIPMLEEVTGRQINATLARTASVLHADRLELLERAHREERAIVEHREGEVRFDARSLAALPPSLGARVVRSALWQLAAVDDEVAPWTRDAVRAVLDLAAGRPGRRRDLPGGRLARRDRTQVRVESSTLSDTRVSARSDSD
jgi:tRNA(Ile)-lysidine synthetase-like protein